MELYTCFVENYGIRTNIDAINFIIFVCWCRFAMNFIEKKQACCRHLIQAIPTDHTVNIINSVIGKVLIFIFVN
jgi:hypothetical protein